jgi:hypothetical protein
LALGQGGTTGSLSGTVTDPKGAVVAGATVVVKNNATGAQFTTQTNNEGAFRVPSLNNGVYTATVTAQGFKQANVTEIKINVGDASSINVELEVGAQTEQVTIVGGGELLKTENATIGTTLTGRQITDIPTASRDALDLVLAMPGTATPGRPRTSTVNGLPKGALNISIDGINVQDNLLKSSDGFFTYIRPRTDAISEVTVSTSNPGAESSGEGAVQIKFTTQSGSSQYNGGLYWYHRNPALNANYYFNNRNLPPDPNTGKAPQNRILLNQYGGKLGGPIWIPGLLKSKDRAFFFVNYEEFRLPETLSRTRTILSPEAQSGVFRYLEASTGTPSLPTCVTFDATRRVCSANVLQLANNTAFPNTGDPTVTSLLSSIRGSLSGAVIQNTGNPNLQTASFINPGGQDRFFPTVRFDFKVTKKHNLENIWNYQTFKSQVDFLNGVDPAFPGFPNFGSQDSIRFSNTTALRSTLTPNLVNEARFGLVGGTVLFFPQVSPAQFQNQAGFNLGIGAAGISGATVTTTTQRRNTPVKQFSDTLSWVKGSHSMSFGFNFTKVNFFQQIFAPVIPNITFGVDQVRDGAFALFNGLPANQRAGAAALYATLTGRITAIGANARLDENTDNYKFLGDLISRASQSEYGIFAQDTWRVRQNLTLSYGLRWEVQLPFVPGNNTYSATTFAGLFGESGQGNLFRPGTLAGAPTQFVRYNEGDKAYNTNYGNFAPSVGFTYSPNFREGFMRRIFGNSGQTVLRGGFSMAYIREGVNTFQSIFASNPGGTIDATRSLTLNNLPVGTLLRNRPFAPPTIPTQPAYPITGVVTNSANAFSPNQDIGYVESWSFGVQREITPNMVFEARYIGNRGHKLWRQYNLNEVNVFENGFLNEFRLAQQNLVANINAGRGLNFRYFGAGTGTSPLPIILGHFAGLSGAAVNDPARYSSTLFANATFVNALHPLAPSPVGFAATLASAANESLFGPNRAAAGIPINFFVVNPGKRGGAFIFDNGSQTWYDAVTLELRRRLAKGLLVQANYTFGKSLSNAFASSSLAFANYFTLRNPALSKYESPFDVTQSFKTNFIYELPVGKGKTFLGDAGGFLDKFVGGWGFNGNIRIQSGTPFSFGNVQLVGLTKKELQNAIGVYREADGFVYFLPADIRQNTIRAFNLGFATGTNQPVYIQGNPQGRYIAPAATGNCLQGFTGGCGFADVVLKGPAFFRWDLSVVKKVRFTERTNFELRAEFLNAFNNINFIAGNPAADVNAVGGFNLDSFSRFTSAYQDLSTTNDPGGRLVQIVLRLNF